MIFHKTIKSTGLRQCAAASPMFQPPMFPPLGHGTIRPPDATNRVAAFSGPTARVDLG